LNAQPVNAQKAASPWRILLPVAVGTSLSLVGDSSLYAVLPTQTDVAGVSVASVGILLSANRFIRLATNGPTGIAYDRFSRRKLFVAALFIGAFSTAIYALTRGFWPLLVGRLLWGLSWSGIWIGGNTIILDMVDDDTRGRWMGLYQFSFFLGSASGAILGGLLTDLLGFHWALLVGAGLTLTGAIFNLLLLPETGRTAGLQTVEVSEGVNEPDPSAKRAGRWEFASIAALYSANRLVIPGILTSTLGFFLLLRFGEQVQIARWRVGVASLTGLSLGASTLIAMFSSLLAGWLSDHAGNRWRSAAGGLLPGILGFTGLALGLPGTIIAGIPLTAVTSGSNQGLATILVGDISARGGQSRRLGLLFTAGDFMSAVGPPLAYALIPLTGPNVLYGFGAVLFGILFVLLLSRSAVVNASPRK